MEERQKIKASMIRWLARRDYARGELQRKAAAKYAASALIEEILQEIEALGYLDDGRFSEKFVRSRAERGYGPYRIANELRERGVADSVATQALEAFEGDWFECALRVKRKKHGGGVTRDVREILQQKRFLHYRGFTADQIEYAVQAAEAL